MHFEKWKSCTNGESCLNANVLLIKHLIHMNEHALVILVSNLARSRLNLLPDQEGDFDDYQALVIVVIAIEIQGLCNF